MPFALAQDAAVLGGGLILPQVDPHLPAQVKTIQLARRGQEARG